MVGVGRKGGMGERFEGGPIEVGGEAIPRPMGELRPPRLARLIWGKASMMDGSNDDSFTEA